MHPQFNPETDLKLERITDVRPELVWRALTEPELLKKWYCPVPWQTVEAEVDLRPGGRFATVMQSPEGEKFPNEACYLEVVPGRKLVWTDALGPDYRPSARGILTEDGGFYLTAHLVIEPEGTGTRYTAYALHARADGQKAHETMGFYDGWGTTFDQMVALLKTM